MYNQGRDSGGGGSGYGKDTNCSGGGGASGWIFTKASLKRWQSGNPSDASKCQLNSSFYLSDATTLGGDMSFANTNGNGNEVGHRGDGYTKITPL